ncbi:MAG: helix-turn-helix domain-containing protein [Pseudomonadota bacterium]
MIANTAIRLAQNIETVMSCKKLTRNDLAEKSGIPYSTITPILNGSRDIKISTFLTICNTLNVTPNKILAELYTATAADEKNKHQKKAKQKPEYLMTLISMVSETHCRLVAIKKNKTINISLKLPIQCGMIADECIGNIMTALEILNKETNLSIKPKEIAVFIVTQQYDRENARKRIEKAGNVIFNNFIIEADYSAYYHTFVGGKNGICIAINDGDIITYSINKGKVLQKIHGNSFPISDIAGNQYIGRAGVIHAVRVKENLEAPTNLSNKILALYNHNLCSLTETVNTSPEASYRQISEIIKSLAHDPNSKAHQIITTSAALIMETVNDIDRITETKLPIVMIGNLASLYTNTINTPRIKQINMPKQYNQLCDYSIAKLQQMI